MPILTHRSLHRKFIAFVAGLSIAITGLSAVPAAADQDDTARALAAILGLAIVGAVIHDSRKDKDHVTRHDTYRPVARPGYRPDPRPLHPRPLPPRANNRKLLPQACLRTFHTRQGKVNGFGDKCLSNRYRYSNSLPQACVLRFRNQNGYGRGYDARCLRQRGYELARR
ncbi:MULTISPECIES: cytochrome C oxidase subunit IV family protein [Roseobacteraceae]|jgi:hypothetical protein|uniref:Uncharacterized protein n=1 Tax=Pseudosulfitobacter pseudonitzschiae TaxID=1402135 RepID=A0A221K4L1_9RHOB|nr:MULTISPECIES: cytochrome C oxidase subunit IV family protein [Roseobacteraceae]ASM73777.1 hypothetical protein SULPSESMR1_02996 [Pseudosulfitobacter pseudonitzschiae]